MPPATDTRQMLLKLRADLEAAIDMIDGQLLALETHPPVPGKTESAKNLILNAVRRAPRQGRLRGEIREYVLQHSGVVLKGATITGTLQRLRRAGEVVCEGGVWFPARR
jgi:hypothetical protein